MGKFDILEDNKADTVVKDAALQEKRVKKEGINISLKNFPADLKEAIENNTDETVSAYIRRAVRQLAKTEDIL